MRAKMKANEIERFFLSTEKGFDLFFILGSDQKIQAYRIR